MDFFALKYTGRAFFSNVKIIYCEMILVFMAVHKAGISNCEALCGLVREKDCEGLSFSRDKVFIRIISEN